MFASICIRSICAACNMSARLSIEATVVGENRGFAQCTTLCFILLPKHFIMLSNSLKE